MRETSLEEFLDGSAEGESATGEGDESAAPDFDADGTAEPTESDATTGEPIEPATATYAWTPERADCAACGTAVERRWRDDDRLVCADCKSW